IPGPRRRLAKPGTMSANSQAKLEKALAVTDVIIQIHKSATRRVDVENKNPPGRDATGGSTFLV
ncbi:MAG TPA: hypothetical protein VFS42_03100, partial [Burkholderiaceae bacterium]|nr:hypothetical protein [Burkholderiaceae bacterium]